MMKTVCRPSCVLSACDDPCLQDRVHGERAPYSSTTPRLETNSPFRTPVQERKVDFSCGPRFVHPRLVRILEVDRNVPNNAQLHIQRRLDLLPIPARVGPGIKHALKKGSYNKTRGCQPCNCEQGTPRNGNPTDDASVADPTTQTPPHPTQRPRQQNSRPHPLEYSESATP